MWMLLKYGKRSAPWTYIYTNFFSVSIYFKKHILNFRMCEQCWKEYSSIILGREFPCALRQTSFLVTSYLVFHCAYDKFNGKDKKRVLSSREIDQLSHFWNEFSQSNQTFRVKYCFFNIKYSFQHGKKLSEDTRSRILCFGQIIYMHYNTFHICLQTYSNNRIR